MAGALAQVTETEYNLGCAGQLTQLYADKALPHKTRMPGLAEALRARTTVPATPASTPALTNEAVQSPLSWPPTYCPPQD